MNSSPTDTKPEREEAARLLRDDTRFASAKIAFFQYFTVAIFVFLASGFWDLQVRNPDFYLEQAEKNRVRSVPVLAPRGKILDRDGRVIVDNHSSFKLMLTRENLKTEHLAAIAEGLHLDVDDLRARLRRFESRPKYEPIVIKQELTQGELDFVESHKDPETFPEMVLLRTQGRLYPHDGLAAHVIGYVGEISESELDAPEFTKYRQGDVIGKYGLERQYNESLMGVDGQRRVVVDNMGRERGDPLVAVDAIPGKSLQVTLDLDLQAVAELAMAGKRGAVVALDPRNGEVLAMVSRPAYDPNLFTGRIRSQDWKELTSNPFNPLFNRAIQAQFAPGSTFKPLVALAGLESGIIDSNYTAHCPGGASFYGHYYSCHLKHGHGAVDLHKGIVQSCDVYFYNVGNRIGIDAIAKYAQLAGLGHKTGIDLPNEASGLMPSTQWALRAQRRKWYLGETISVAIGQGAVTVTPLQLAVAIGGIANGGVWHRPHLVKEQTHPDSLRQISLNSDNITKIINGMYGVVNEGGTGFRAQIPGLEVCGKTGSAQLVSNELVKASKNGLGATMKDNAWFVGFAPRQAPEIVVVALFENAEHGPLAAPIVRDVLKAYFDKKARLTGHAQQIAAAPTPPKSLFSPPAEIPVENPNN